METTIKVEKRIAMVLFLTSNIGGIKKENGQKIPVEFYSKNQFLLNMKKSLKNNKKFVLIASNPFNFEQNDKFLEMDIEALKLSNLSFDECLILDNRNKTKVSEVLKDSSLIFLCGGNTYIQNQFFNEIDLKNYIKDLDSTIVGISAGAINSADIVFNSPEEDNDLSNPYILVGLGLTEFNIEPHFDIHNDNILQMKSILDESYKRVIYGLPDGSYIVGNKVYGRCYKIYQGNIEIICNDNECFLLE
mgnify:FL=1